MPLAGTPRTTGIPSHRRQFGHFVDGAWREPAEGVFFDSTDPASGEKIAAIAQGSAADVDAAVRAARGAFPKWQALTPHARARYLYALARAVQRHSRRLAVLETIDNGKPIRESRDIDIPLVARHFYHHAGWAQLLDSEFPGYTACGVVGQIIPWNFPLLMLAWKIAPALATGNTVVLKPAEYTPLTALAFADICQEIGLPAGVVNIVTGDGATGEALVKHPEVDKIAFTGSTEVGRAIRSATSASHKRLSLELGGKSPFIIFEDADLDSAVEGLVDGIWFNQGQVCCAGSRLLMQESIADALLEKVRDRMGTLRIGPPLDKAIDIGAIVAPVQLERIKRLVDQGVAEGATCWQPQIEMPSRGLYFPPTLLSNVHPTSVVAQQEIFGPVLAAMTFRTPAEAVELANNTVYGLASSKNAPALRAPERPPSESRNGHQRVDPAIDRTVKLYIGGKQARPDSGYSIEVRGAKGELLGEAPLGNRKDIRNAVEAARKAASWAKTTAHNRAQVLYYMAENLSLRREEIAHRLAAAVGEAQALREVSLGTERIFTYAAWADKFDGGVHNPPFRTIAIAMKEPIGTVGIICPSDAPLLGLLSLVLPVLAAGNTAVVVPSELYPLIVGDLYQVFDTSDLPAGAVNLVSGYSSQLLKTLAEHDDVDAVWCFADEASAAAAKSFSVGNLKQVFTNEGRTIDWFDPRQGEGRWFLEHATQVKNIWVPYGE